MTNAVASDCRAVIAERIDTSRQLLAARWLEELKRLVPVAANDIFPGDQLLGQIPALIQELAAFLRAPADEAIAANAVVTARATELGRLRHGQRAPVHQMLREYRTFRGIVIEFIKEEIDRLRLTPSADELIELMDRIEAVIDILRQTTVDTFVAEYTDAITQHTTRLEGFNRMVTHELRQPLQVLQFALKMLGTQEPWTDRAKRDQILATAGRNVTRMTATLGKLVTLSRSAGETGSALAQRVELSAIVTDVIGELDEMADARGVDIRITGPLPAVTIDVARLELVLVNLISNAIKYSDPDKAARVVEIASEPSARPDMCMVSVRDNGIGIADAELRSIFGRFYRGHAERDRELGTNGLGLGLSIVADCVEALKGDVRVESTLGEGTTFFLELPLTSGM